jgi:uncharacterized protein (TIGR02452 family)
MKRSERLAVARETVDIVRRGYYEVAGRRVDISAAVRRCHDRTRCFTAGELYALRESVLGSRPEPWHTEIEVVNETTLAGLARLASEAQGAMAVLNFASAKNPGGGFLNGSQAQEESLARSSALYSSLLKASPYYEQHRASSSCLYSDTMILSPDCPVFRRDDGALLQEPHLATFITSPAPNAGAVARNRPSELPLVPQVLQARSELVLALAAAHDCPQLILGAWGCGVFRNDPHVVAQAFASHILGKWAGRFRRIVFSVLDTSRTQETFTAFQAAFGNTA